VKSGRFVEDMIPTVGFNMRKVTKGNVTIKVGVTHWIAFFQSILISHRHHHLLTISRGRKIFR